MQLVCRSIITNYDIDNIYIIIVISEDNSCNKNWFIQLVNLECQTYLLIQFLDRIIVK
ncbi:hypothetical protein MOUN0_B03334 [Monosporozyma unispora]